jgi:large subunit ribosomal protein L32
MPNPKRRHSTRRTAIRRSHDFLTAVGLSECPNCHEKKLPRLRQVRCVQGPRGSGSQGTGQVN